MKRQSIERKKDVALEVKEEKFLIGVPQGCYALLTPQTDQKYVGLYTIGLYPCCAVIGEGKSDGATQNSIKFLYLCHADTGTQLDDTMHGLKGWIGNMAQYCTQINIYYDLRTPLKDGVPYYKNIIDPIIDSIMGRLSKVIVNKNIILYLQISPFSVMVLNRLIVEQIFLMI
jgi:hypothetical protein